MPPDQQLPAKACEVTIGLPNQSGMRKYTPHPERKWRTGALFIRDGAVVKKLLFD